jgi:hypothetical protein
MISVAKLEIFVSLLALMCGPILCWRRRDNVFGYLLAGLFFVSVFVPLFGTTLVDRFEPGLVDHYARILMMGAVFFLGGLLYGAVLGGRSRRPPVTFDRPLPLSVPRILVRRARWATALAVVAMLASFKLLGYVPLLAADRQSAKYGVGAYKAGFARGSLVYHVALALASSVAPVVLAVAFRRRRGIDVVLGGLLLVALLATLNRGEAFLGPLIFLVALAVERGWKPSHILAGVCLAFVAGTLANELIYTSPPTTRPSIATRVAATAPDLSDHLLFLNGFGLGGEQFVGTKTLQAGVSLTRSKGDYDPAAFAVRTITGVNDLSDLASGGARLPPAVWGYAAYGMVGAAIWSFVSGLFTGWGTALTRRLVTNVRGAPGQSLNLILAHVFYSGTFLLVANFYFPERSNIVVFVLAVALTISTRNRRHAQVPTPETALSH